MAVWFEADDFDAAVNRIRDAAVRTEADVHHNSNAGHREMWLRDDEGYLVVVAEP